MGLFGLGKQGHRLSVLHIDDSHWIRIPVSVILRRHFGMRVIEAATGIEGLSLAESEQPDLIILDVMMPGMDGYDTLLKLKANPKTRDIPVLMCTSRDATSEVNKALEMGAAGYVTKPIEEELLITRVQSVLQATGKWMSAKPDAGRGLPNQSSVETVVPAGAPDAKSGVERPCPSCRGNLTFIKEYTAWYCFSCRKYPDYSDEPA